MDGNKLYIAIAYNVLKTSATFWPIPLATEGECF